MKTIKMIFVLLIFGAGMLGLISTSHAQPPWTQKADMPAGRKGHVSCMLDGKIYVLGGKGSDSTLSSIDVYEPETDTWDTTKADMAKARFRFSSCVIDGKILAICGNDSSYYNPIISIEEYDPVSDSWSHKADLPRERVGARAAVVHDKIYVFGGFREPGLWIMIPEVDVYDLQTNTWDTTKADLKTPRWRAASVVINDKIYFIGGEKAAPWPGLHTVEAYDPATDTWSTKADMLTGRKGFGACAVDGMIYVFGGSTGWCSGIISSVERYDPLMDSWEYRTPMPSILAGPSAVQFNGKVYVSGGSVVNCPSIPLKTMYEYNPALDPETEVIGDHIKQQPGWFTLYQNYPNPFNPSTMIHYQLPKHSEVELAIYNMMGQKIVTLVSEQQSAGTYRIEWNAKDLTSGIYLVRLEAGDYREVKKLILQK